MQKPPYYDLKHCKKMANTSPMKVQLASCLSCRCQQIKAVLDDKVFVAIPHRAEEGLHSLANGSLMAQLFSLELMPTGALDSGFDCRTVEIRVSNEVMRLENLEKVEHHVHPDIGNCGEGHLTQYTAVFYISGGKFLKVHISGKYLSPA